MSGISGEGPSPSCTGSTGAEGSPERRLGGSGNESSGAAGNMNVQYTVRDFTGKLIEIWQQELGINGHMLSCSRQKFNDALSKGYHVTVEHKPNRATAPEACKPGLVVPIRSGKTERATELLRLEQFSRGTGQ